MAIEIVDLPIKHGWIFHSYVKLPGWYQELLATKIHGEFCQQDKYGDF
jgi:hypothetical protein